MKNLKITADRCAEVCNILEYRLGLIGNFDTITRILPRFAVDDNGEYIVSVTLNDDGEVEEYHNITEGLVRVSGITPNSLRKLIPEFVEAFKNIVNPQNGKA